jgi:hypothetical protein
MPIEELHARFRKKRAIAKPQPAEDQEGKAEDAKPAAVQGPKILKDRELAERQMLGILLKEPQRWHQVSLAVHPFDFGDVTHRRLAETYWQHQQDLGEPVFSEFLGGLDEPALKELAVELMEMAEELAEVEETLKGALNFLDEEKRRRDEQKHLAELRRISQQNVMSPADVEAKWAEFVKNNQAMDPKRLGPVRRFRSGS